MPPNATKRSASISSTRAAVAVGESPWAQNPPVPCDKEASTDLHLLSAATVTATGVSSSIGTSLVTGKLPANLLVVDAAAASTTLAVIAGAPPFHGSPAGTPSPASGADETAGLYLSPSFWLVEGTARCAH